MLDYRCPLCSREIYGSLLGCRLRWLLSRLRTPPSNRLAAKNAPIFFMRFIVSPVSIPEARCAYPQPVPLAEARQRFFGENACMPGCPPDAPSARVPTEGPTGETEWQFHRICWRCWSVL